MKKITYLTGIVGLIFMTFIFIYAQKTDKSKMSDDEMKDCPLHAQHQKANKEKAAETKHDHLAQINARGEQGMGFSQTATTHHFLMYSDGGAIQVEVNDLKDKENLEKIRRHLTNIAESFTSGDFSTPMAVHAELPAGAKTMQLLKAKITYQYSETEKGGQVKITTRDEVALSAIYDFIRYQIVEHQTGDPLEITK
jgi:hypothetical protein